MTSEGLDRNSAEKTCGKKAIMSEERHETRKQLKRVLKNVDFGTAVSASYKLLLSGSKSRKIEGFVLVGEKTPKFGDEETIFDISMNLEMPQLRSPLEISVTANGQVKRPTSEWEKEDILKSDLTSKILVDGIAKYGDESKSLRSTIVAYSSDDYKSFVKESEEWRKCSEDEREGRKMTESCRVARHMASSLDTVHTKLAIPKEITENRFVQMVTEASKVFFLPYSNLRHRSKTVGPMREYEIEAKVDGRGRYLTISGKGNGEEIVVRDYPLRWNTKELLPICTKESFVEKILQKLTRQSAPSTCKIEPRDITTFDGKKYRYTVNDCEHVAFAEESPRPRVVVSTKKTQQQHVVKMYIDGERYEVEIPRETKHSHRSQAIIKVNGQEKQVQNTRQIEDMTETHVITYEDGVYSIHSHKYGVEVTADGERLMVRTNELVFRNRATGLCGDLNGEETADLKTGNQCLLSEPELVGYSFMLEDGKCQGAPEEKKSVIHREEQRCVKEKVEPTQVTEIFGRNRHNPTERKHLMEEQERKICFSKQMIRVCSNSTPKEIRSRKVEYVCLTGPEANIMKKRATSGDRIQELTIYPSDFSQNVYEPSQC